jgi:hypothetical protein
MAKRANKTPSDREWIVSILRGSRPAEQLGAVKARDSDAAIAKAIETFAITDTERQRRVIVRPIADR